MESLQGAVTSLLRNLRDGEDDLERGQAIVRLIVVPAFMLYLIPTVMFQPISTTTKTVFIGYFLAWYVPTSLLLVWHIVKWPGVNIARRVAAIIHDYSAMAFALSVGGAATLPVFAMLLWVTVGNGIRFGQYYLVFATVLALLSLMVPVSFNEYWRSNPYLVLTLVVSTVLVPTYVLMLLRRIQKAHDIAIEANRAKSRFLAQASHDLRQPIHAISLFTACLRDGSLDRDQEQMVENIDRSLQSVSRLFRSLLDISTLDSGKVAAQMEPVSIAELVDDIVQQNSEAAQWAGVPVRVVSVSHHVRTDRTLLSTMLQNIVTNALKYAPNEPILIGCRRRGGALSIEVHDRGPGIAEEHLLRIFDEFYQIRERGDKDVEGVGLGLPIVRRLGALLGLTVRVSSKAGRGTGVIIDGLEIVAAAAVVPSGADLAPSSLVHGMRVLLVEDDRDVLVATATLLRKWGCLVQAETAPPKVIAGCDILITDYDLGAGLTGSDCIAHVRRLAGELVPAIVMTGHDEGRVRAELATFEIPILAKPVRPAELRSMLRAHALSRIAGP